MSQGGSRVTGRVTQCLIADGGSFRSRETSALDLDFTGIVGDIHSGATRGASSREPWYRRGTPIRNNRQVTLVSGTELAEVAIAMELPEIAPEWIGANLVIDEISGLTRLPVGTRLFFSGGAVLMVEGENAPCRIAGASIAEHYPRREGLDLLFPKLAKHRRGLIASVERPGRVAAGETFTARIPAPRNGRRTMAEWSAGQYVKFEDERSRPSVELVARVPLAHPRRVVDIGCGPGNSTAIVRARWPEAEVIGVDSAPDMLRAARERLPGVTFIKADAATWEPPADVDVFFSNATMQWVPRHRDVLLRLMRALPEGGVLAVQVPDNQAEPTHELMRAVAAEGPWRAKFAEPIAREIVATPGEYYDLLRPFGGVDVWHTVYYHPLADAGGIVEWVKGTGLRPFLDRLEGEEQSALLAEYRARIAAAYPSRVDGKVLLRFPRLFLVAVKAGQGT